MTPGYFRLGIKIKKRIFILYSAHLIVTLAIAEITFALE